MALKKSELYSSLWSSCDELRGGMDASQYKDYVLVLLFIKYISDKYTGVPYAPIVIPHGASFKDMVALKGKPDIGDQINKKIIAPLANANKLSDFPDFNDATKLGSGKEMVERLTNLVAIFESPALDFSKNRAEGDDLLGDAYEFLMRHFATESGKSKGQFYTPAEVSLIMALIIGIREAKTTSATTAYDPTAGSASLLLKVADQASSKITLYGQEKDAATSGLARMNMILHDNPTAVIAQGNTLADPKFRDGDTLKTFDYVVANPPFSDKRWSTGLDPLNDPHERFKPFGVPPAKQGDYAYLLHIIRSMKSTGKGACILPHGVLFRGNAEADIRRALIRKGYIKGIIGLPANLFYGTGIPACIVVLDKEGAHTRKGIFMTDASAGFMKDGPKNRLRAQDIHKIVDVFTKRLEVPRFSRMVPFSEIEKNDFNLNLPRYIDSQQTEDKQDIEGHLKGGTPIADVAALQPYWDVCPNLRRVLFRKNRTGYVNLAVDKAVIKSTIYGHPEFATFITSMNDHFAVWRKKTARSLRQFKPGFHPKQAIGTLSEDLLTHYAEKPLIDAYSVYQHIMDYWAETMQDDCYLIAGDGWKAGTTRIVEKDKKGKEKDKGWTCDLVPKAIIVVRTVNTRMVIAYWLIGREIVEEEQGGKRRAGYGDAMIRDLSQQLTERYGKGFSIANLKNIRQFHLCYADRVTQIRYTLCSELPSAVSGSGAAPVKADTDKKSSALRSEFSPASLNANASLATTGVFKKSYTVCSQFAAQSSEANHQTLSSELPSAAPDSGPTLLPADTDKKSHTVCGELTPPPGSQPFAPELSWSHYRLLMRVENDHARAFYEAEAAQARWSVRDLERQINSLLFERLLKSRDQRAVMARACEQAPPQTPVDVLKDPYILEFLGLPESHELVESQVEQALATHMRQFLLELGCGFAFVARQQRLTLDGDHFYVDLVFYHTRLKCYVLIDLKVGKLTHENLGQMQLYVNYYDRDVCAPDDNPTVGLILCTDRNESMVRYTLPAGQNQIYASRYRTALPSEEELTRLLRRDWDIVVREHEAVYAQATAP